MVMFVSLNDEQEAYSIYRRQYTLGKGRVHSEGDAPSTPSCNIMLLLYSNWNTERTLQSD